MSFRVHIVPANPVAAVEKSFRDSRAKQPNPNHADGLTFVVHRLVVQRRLSQDFDPPSAHYNDLVPVKGNAVNDFQTASNRPPGAATEYYSPAILFFPTAARHRKWF